MKLPAVVGLGIWAACAIAVLGYTRKAWTATSNS